MAFPLASVRLLDGPFRRNAERNASYLNFLDPDRLLRTFRLNYGLTSGAVPCGGWEAPASKVRGHFTGHLLSGLALTYASTGDAALAEKGTYLVGRLAACQRQARYAGYNNGYLSAFPEEFFDALEAGRPVWSPYYMIHKLMAGLIDTHELLGDALALEVAVRLADWVDWRTSRLSYDHMQQILRIEHGGIMEALANIHRLTGDPRYLRAAGRFYQAGVFDPLADGQDLLAGVHANMTVPKMISCIRMWEETGDVRYHAIGANFWQIVTDHHCYIIGGASNHEHFQEPDAIARQLSNFTCENCVSYNMLKLTRLLHFHQLDRVDLIDYYERTLFNQMLGEQDPDSPHGFNAYYTGLSAGAFKRQPLNYFPAGDPDVYSTDYDNFTCDDATGVETQAKFADTIYTHSDDALFVNLFIPSEVTWASSRLTIRQTTGFPDEPATHLTVTAGSAKATLRVRVPGWAASRPRAWLNGGELHRPVSGDWLSVTREWRRGDRLDISLPMAVAANPAPDDPAIQAITYGPIVLSGDYGPEALTALPTLDTASLRRAPEYSLSFTAAAGGLPVTLIPIARTQHDYYTVYWRT